MSGDQVIPAVEDVLFQAYVVIAGNSEVTCLTGDDIRVSLFSPPTGGGAIR